MATTSSVEISTGIGTFVPTYDISEDSVTKKLQRAVLNDSTGTELGTSSNPLAVNLSSLIGGEDLVNNLIGTLDKPAISGSYAWLPFNAAGDVDYSVKNASGNLRSVWAINRGAGVVWLQIHNKATVPTSGNAATFWYPIAAGSATVPALSVIGLELLGSGGMYLTTGIAIGISTAKTTFTAATAADVDMGGFYY